MIILSTIVLHVILLLITAYYTLQSNLLVKTNEKQTRNHEERFSQEEVERRGSTVTRGATTDPPDKM